ncbi:MULTISPECIES: sirohydrochlorin chelatase [unclassified Prochlorococcus]|uniref:sirohydrochlorin chelatase n=1 Tax=unclassified Prochlorococcus TaxID=2627481 RepID=UPI000533BBCD|nr:MULTISPECIES: sirohydrochlorin chelatase [unclassified Prochlorococcus]KGG15121.1 Sirohydrochlorin cobaltochelatase [Prochlorococcus sp. MIT 0602]KGG17393.1 Sirohydrochlorin cobaltochelatase [Prochlorococcus sp. MIT 0603]
MITGLLDKIDANVGILIIGHGSRNVYACNEFAELAQSIKSLLPSIPVEYGYLEFSRPIISDALETLRRQSVRKVIAIPAMLFAAGHAKNDIPSVLNAYAAKTGIEILYGRELGIDNSMISAAGQRINQAISPIDDFNLNESLLVVVGRGSSDPDANSNVSKITRMLVESLGFAWGETVYSGVTFPLVEPGLRHLVKLGFRRIVVFPYFLFSGVLVSRIRRFVDLVAKDFPEVEFVHAGYLGNHKKVRETFLERISEAISGDSAMNCSLCKYRSNLLGFENDVGLPQSSHHHHVEGLLNGCDLCEGECSGKCESLGLSLSDQKDHVHSHSNYPHANHPFGPVTLRTLNQDQI